MTADPIATLPPVRTLLEASGAFADKRFGQHFLFDLNLTGKIARLAGDLTQGTTIEIGPGPGGLTRALLLAGARRVIAVEKDRRMVEVLAPLVQAARGRLVVVEADALTLDPVQLARSNDPDAGADAAADGGAEGKAAPVRICANLPYNVGTPMLVNWLHRLDDLESLTLMFQKEVADRIAAPVGSADYGRLAVLAQYVAVCDPLFDIPPQAFVPPPKVMSSVIQLTPRATRGPADIPLPILEQVTAAAFGQRRKMLRASLKSMTADPMPLIAAAGLDPQARAETVPVEGFVALARAWAALKSGAQQ